jgi:glycosyltransferase involved in cell wall biosynthesis
MKVLMVSKTLCVGSAHGRLREMAKLGVDLTVIVPPRFGNQPLEVEDAEDYKIRVLRCWLTPYNHFHFYPAALGPFDADLVFLEEEPWSLVTHQFMRHSVKLRKPAVFFTWQNINKHYPPPFNYFERYSHKHARAAVAGNQEAYELLRRRGFDKPITLIPPPGIDPDHFRKRDVTELRRTLNLEDAFVIGFVGRIVSSKGIQDLIRAFAALPARCFLVLVGDGEERPRAEELAKRLGVMERTRWISQVPSLRVPDYMNLLDVLVLPSRTCRNWKEQFGRVLVEAMACETPPVGSDSGEIPNVIGDAGLVFPEGDVGALAERLRCLYENPGLIARFAKKGRARILQYFAQDFIAKQYVQLFDEVLSAPAVTP